MHGTLSLPERSSAVVVFAHGSGSSRQSPRNRLVAQDLQHAGLGTLLLDLLEEDEAGDRSKVFDIVLLAERLRCASDWLAEQPGTAGSRLGYFGASTGAGAALQAAAAAPERVGAIVSRGGRPDLARDVLPIVIAPTLLIVGGDDEIVVELNREAFDLLAGPRAARDHPRRDASLSRARSPGTGRHARESVVSQVSRLNHFVRAVHATGNSTKWHDLALFRFVHRS